MANSLRAKISKLRHDGKISDSEYQELIKKLYGHDKQTRADAIDECIAKIDTLKQISFGIVTTELVKVVLEQLKEQKQIE